MDNALFPAHSIPKTESFYYDQYLVQLVLLVNPGFLVAFTIFIPQKLSPDPTRGPRATKLTHTYDQRGNDQDAFSETYEGYLWSGLLFSF